MFAAVSALTLTYSSVASDQSPPPLLGQWPMLDNARDISGEGHDGVIKGGAVFSSDQKALIFDGIDDYVTFGPDIAIKGNFSIALWLCPDWPTDGAQVMRLLGKFRLQNEKILAIFADRQTRLWCYISEDGGADGKRAILKATAQPAIPESQWYFLTVRWDAARGADGLTFAINGIPTPSVAASDANLSGLSNKKVDLTLGAYDVQTVTENGVTRDVVNNPFRGMISGLTIWDGVISDETVAAQFAGGRMIGKTPAPPPVAPAVSGSTPPTKSATLTSLLQAVLTADAEPDYERAFAAKQSFLKELDSTLGAGGVSDMNVVLDIAARLAPDLDEEQRQTLAANLLKTFAPNVAALKGLSPVAIERLATALWDIDHDVGREFVTMAFSDETVWGQWPSRTLALLAMFGGKQYGPEAVESVLNAELLAKLDLRWSAATALTAEDMANIALAWGGAWQGAKARVWALKHYQALLGSETARKVATVATLRRVAEVFRDAHCFGAGNEYPEFRTVLLALAEAGAFVNSEDADLFAYLIQTEGAKTKLRDMVGKCADGRGLSAAKVLAAAHARSNTLHLWWKELEQKKKDVAGSSPYERLVMGIVDAKRVAGGNPLRRLWHVERAWKEAGAEDVRFECLEEYADLWRQRGRPGVAFDRVLAHAGTFDGKRAELLQTLAGKLESEERHRLREGQRFQKLLERHKQKRKEPLDPSVSPSVAAFTAEEGAVK